MTSFDISNFDENEIVLTEPTQTTDVLVELYQNGDYIATLTVEHVLMALQTVLDDDLNDYSAVEDDGSAWIKAISLRIAAAAFRQWVEDTVEEH